MIDPSQSVFIEFCHNCANHSWCTKHDEARYYNLFALIKSKIEEEFPSLTVYGNTHPLSGRPMSPTLGAFEVSFNKHKIFSKLKTRTWATTKQVLASIRAILDGQNPADCELIDYSAFPYTDKPKTNSAGLPSARRTFLGKLNTTGPYLNHDGSVRTLSRNELETIYCNTPGLAGTPRKIAASSLGRVDTNNNSARPGTSNHMPNLKNPSSFRPGNNYLSVNDVNKRPYYLPQDPRYKSAAFVDEQIGTLPEIRPSIVIAAATNGSYLNISENENVNSHRSFVDIPNVLPSPKVGSIANELHSAFRTQALLEPEQPKRHYRSYSTEVTIKQTKDLEANEETIFTQQHHQEEREDAAQYRSTPFKKLFKRAAWFPDCQREKTSPERAVRSSNFEEKLKPFTNLRRPESGRKEQMTTYSSPTKGKDLKAGSHTLWAKMITNLKKLEFADEKLSQIEIAKDKISKKKITFVPDTHRPCKMEVYCSIHGVVGPEFGGVSVMKGATFKVPLKFEGKELRDCHIFILKDGRPFQKIIMDIYLV